MKMVRRFKSSRLRQFFNLNFQYTIMFPIMFKFTKFLAVAIATLLAAMVLPSSSNAGFSTSANWQIEKREWRQSTGGYLLATSNNRGDNVSVFVTCNAKTFSLSIGKIGNFHEGEFKEKLATAASPCIKQSALPTSKWVSNTSFETSQLEGGMYLIKIIDADGFKSFIPMVIRDEASKSRAVFVVPTMTMFAYNSWSGRNTYEGTKGFEDRLRIVDFRAPFDTGFGTGKYWNYVHPLIVEIEKLGIDVDYVTDTDLHFSPDLLRNRKLYISAGHDEYWTKAERESVIEARKSGMNLVFLGANAGYWQARLRTNDDKKSVSMEIYKSKKEDPNKRTPTIRFRDAGYSESELNGVQYTCFPAQGGFDYFDKSFFGFKGMSERDFVALNKVVGPEVDETPSVNGFAGRVQVVAEGEVKCGNRWFFPKIGRVNMVYGTSSNGGGVFSVGTMGWALHGLRSSGDTSVKEAVISVTRNVLLRGIQGPFSREK